MNWTLLMIGWLSLNIFLPHDSDETERNKLTVKVEGLRSSKGRIRFNLYNEEDVFPDEDFERTCAVGRKKIKGKKCVYTFKNLPQGEYAVNILHDENRNDRIDKGYFLPVEGIGFSNYESFGLMNRPKFSKASFLLKRNKTIQIKVIYM